MTSVAAPQVYQNGTPGPVVSAVQAELSTAPTDRPGLAAVAVALAEILDDPRALSQKPAAAAQLARILIMLAKLSNRGGRLAAVRTMTSGAEYTL